MTRVMVAGWVVGAAAAAVLLTSGVSVAQEDGGAAPAAPSLESLSPGDLLWLARQIAGDDPDRKEARQLLAEHVTKTYLASPDATRSVSCWEWRGFAECFGQDLSAPIRTQWQEKILGAYAGSAETLGTLRPDEIYDVSAAAVTLGAPPAARAALAGRIRGVFDAAKSGSMGFDGLRPVCDARNVLGDRLANESLIFYTETSSEWRSFEPAKLGDLAWRLDSLGEMAAKAQMAVAKHVMATYLGNADVVRAIGLEAWGLLAQMGRNLPAESRQAWAKALKDAFAPRESDLLQMEGRDVACLAWGLDVLDRAQAAALARIWLTKNERLKTADKGDVVGLAYKAVGDAAASPAERDVVPNRMADLFLSQPEQAEDFENCALMVSLWEEIGNRNKTQEWMTKTYQCAVGSEEARAKADPNRLARLANYLRYAGLTGKGKGYAAFAAALAARARDGTLAAYVQTHADAGWGETYPPRILAQPLGTPEARRVLEDELVDPQGSPRLGVAKVLAWAHRHTGELMAWCAFVDARLAETDADAKALWLVAKGYASTLVPEHPDRLRMKGRLDDALAAAVSDPVRLAVLREYAGFYRGLNSPGVAADLLASLRHQFGQETLVEVDELLTRLRQEEAARQTIEARLEVTAEMDRKRDRLAYLRRCLSQAQAGGDADRTTRLQTFIGQLEQDLGQ